MKNIWPEVEHALSPEAVADLRALSSDHAINAELIHSLTTSKEEARNHISFFKRMMIVSNGVLMTVGTALVIFGGIGFIDGISVIRCVALIAGLLLFVKFFTVYLSMSEAIRETEIIAQKHQLI